MARMPKFTLEHREKAAEAAVLAKDPVALAESMNLPQIGEARKRIIDRLADMPATMRRLFCRAYRGKSPAAAIRANCYLCMGYQRKEVPKCTSPECPLYPYRPAQ